MQEISLNILDIAQNSIAANATLVTISVTEEQDRMRVTVEDDGKGMTKEQAESVEDPFYTTRTTRKVGLGVPFFKMAAEMTGGSFSVSSQPGAGTVVSVEFITSHIDCMPLGDINETILSLVTLNPEIDFVYRLTVNGKGFVMDTREFRRVLREVPLNAPEVAQFVREFLDENSREIRI